MAAAGNFNKLQRAREQSFYANAALQLARAEQAQRSTRERLVRLRRRPLTVMPLHADAPIYLDDAARAKLPAGEQVATLEVLRIVPEYRMEVKA